MEAEQDFRVGDETCEFDLAAVLGEQGGDEGGKVKGLIDDHDAAASAGGSGGRGLVLHEGENGIFLGGESVDNAVDAGYPEELSDVSGGVGEAEISVAAAEADGGADDEAEAGAVEALDSGGVEDDLPEVAAGVEVQEILELTAFGSCDEAAFCDHNMNGAADSGFQFQRHAPFYARAGGEHKGEMVRMEMVTSATGRLTGSAIAEGDLKQGVGDAVGGVADDIANIGEVAGDAADAHGLDFLDVGNDDLGALGGVACPGSFRDGRGVDERVVEDGLAGVVVDALDVLGGGEVEALIGLGHQVDDVDAGAAGVGKGAGDAGDEQIGNEAGEE